MTHAVLVNIFGYLATFCMIFGYLPQAVHTIRTRETDSISWLTFLMLGFGSIFFVVQGAMTANLPLVIANSITSICSAIIVVIKARNDIRRVRESKKSL